MKIKTPLLDAMDKLYWQGRSLKHFLMNPVTLQKLKAESKATKSNKTPWVFPQGDTYMCVKIVTKNEFPMDRIDAVE